MSTAKFEQMTGFAAAKGLSAALLADGTNIAYLQADTQNMRFTDDGATAPTAAIGHLLTAGDPPYPYRGNLADLKFIEVTPSAKLNVSTQHVTFPW